MPSNRQTDWLWCTTRCSTRIIAVDWFAKQLLRAEISEKAGLVAIVEICAPCTCSNSPARENSRFGRLLRPADADPDLVPARARAHLRGNTGNWMTADSHDSTTPTHRDTFSPPELDSFRNDGFLIVPGLIPSELLQQVRAVTDRDLAGQFGDVEYEADLHYPGAPKSLDAEGGRTIRRLRQAISRDPVFLRLVTLPGILHRLQQLLGPRIVMPLAHHNCIMTKQPRFSSDTGWHQDTRYWSFSTGDLINIWIALGPENLHNGCLQVLPATHLTAAPRDRLDEALFLRTDLPENQSILATAAPVCLEPGDVLFFHARCFHAATRNFSTQTKQSAVFTFRSLDNPPIPGSRSAAWPELLLS